MLQTSKCTSCGKALGADAKFCPSCGNNVASEPRQVTAVPGINPSLAKAVKHPMSRQARITYTLSALALAFIFLFIFVRHIPGGAHPVIEQQPDIAMATMNLDVELTPQIIEYSVDNGKIRFPLSVLQEKKMIKFDYHTESRTVPVMAFISTEGKLVTAIRMCEPCNSSEFKIEGNELACGHCETRWKLDNLEGIQGSCQKYPPDPIPSEVVGSYVVINEAALKNWKMRI